MNYETVLIYLSEQLEAYLKWLQQHEMFGIPYLKYLISIVVIFVIVKTAKWLLHISRLYILAGLTSRGRITRIRSNVDGDTVKVIDKADSKRKKSIRLIGVDTPESLKSLYMDVAPFGKEASDYTKKRLKPGQRLILLYDKDPIDKFGRELVYVYLATGEFYNATLISKGYAFAANYPPNEKYKNLFLKLQAKAKKRGKRIWDVYEEKNVLGKAYKRSNAYRRFKTKYGAFGKKKKKS